jgi:succinyl-CoA synthetase beta subunit
MRASRATVGMRLVLNTIAAAYIAAAVAACALLAPLGHDDEARRAVKITLAAYETTQQAILIYGRLPTCDAEAGVVRLCKDRAVWTRIKIVERAASAAIAEATPVLNGTTADAGQLIAALMAIENVKNAVGDAQTKLKGAGT